MDTNQILTHTNTFACNVNIFHPFLPCADMIAPGSYAVTSAKRGLFPYMYSSNRFTSAIEP